LPTPRAYWIVFGAGVAALAVLYALSTFARLQVFKMLLSSFFRIAGRPESGRASGAVARIDAAAIHDPGADHHLPGLAARVDGDHRHLHADLHSAAREVQHRSAVLRPAGRAEPADCIPAAAGRDGRVLSEGVSPPHVLLNAIFAGMLPFMAIQVFALFLLYVFPQIGLWLPQLLYR
jgi:hypothetical protein